MQTIGDALGFVVGELSDHNYAQSLDFYRFWCTTGQTHLRIPSDRSPMASRWLALGSGQVAPVVLPAGH